MDTHMSTKYASRLHRLASVRSGKVALADDFEMILYLRPPYCKLGHAV